MAKEELIEMRGVVSEILPDSRYRVTQDNGRAPIAYAGGKMRKNHIRVPGATQQLALSGGPARDFPMNGAALAPPSALSLHVRTLLTRTSQSWGIFQRIQQGSAS